MNELEASFNQFHKPQGNGIKFKALEGKRLSDLLHEYTFRLYNPSRTMPLNIEEITTLFHFPVSTHSISTLRSDSAKQAPAPSSVSGDGVLIGINEYQGVEQEVYFHREDRVRHFYVIGQTGVGKTVILENMIVQDIVNGDGVCFIDPHGEALENIMPNIPPERVKDVIYFAPAYTARPMGLNMLEYDPNYPEQKTFVVNEMFKIFQQLDPFLQPFPVLRRNLTGTAHRLQDPEMVKVVHRFRSEEEAEHRSDPMP